jgi:hypothetical protein
MYSKQLFETLKAGLGNDLKFANGGYSPSTLYGVSTDVEEAYGEDGEAFSVDLVKPHLFPLSSLTKPITVVGYNDNKEFVPMLELVLIDTDFEFHDMDRVHMFTAVDIKVDAVYNTGGEDDDLLLSIGYNSMEHLKNWIVNLLDLWHFNTKNLKQVQFIDANESKVYSV